MINPKETMDRAELVIALCLEHKDGFEKLTKQTLFMLLLTNKLFHTHKKIDVQRVKYYVWYLYHSLNSCISKLVHVKRERNMEMILLQEAKRDSIMTKVHSSNTEIQDSFFRLLIAEYKNNIAYFVITCMSLYDNRMFLILKEFDNIIYDSKELYNMVLNYQHNSKHYIFENVYKHKFVEFEIDYKKDEKYLFQRWDSMNGRKSLQKS